MESVLSFFNSFGFQAIIKLILGFMLAGIIGLERSSWSKPAGFRTHALVGISSVLIMLCGEYMSRAYDIDPSRIPAQLLSGIGFIGAGTILRDGFNVKGLTTAAGLLAVTCIGLSIGAGFFTGRTRIMDKKIPRTIRNGGKSYLLRDFNHKSILQGLREVDAFFNGCIV